LSLIFTTALYSTDRLIIIIIIIITDVDVDVDVDLDPDPDLDSGVSTVDAVIACVVFDRPIMPNTT